MTKLTGTQIRKIDSLAVGAAAGAKTVCLDPTVDRVGERAAMWRRFRLFIDLLEKGECEDAQYKGMDERQLKEIFATRVAAMAIYLGVVG